MAEVNSCDKLVLPSRESWTGWRIRLPEAPEDLFFTRSPVDRSSLQYGRQLNLFEDTQIEIHLYQARELKKVKLVVKTLPENREWEDWFVREPQHVVFEHKRLGLRYFIGITPTDLQDGLFVVDVFRKDIEG
ncbi:MAG: hypothetical protein Q8R11_00105 [bacterium]|nr:hypothetical protein [bacterium]